MKSISQLLALTLAAVLRTADAADFSFTRTATNDAPGAAAVTLSITFDGTGVCQAVEERLPGPLSTNGAPSAEGVYLPDRDAIRWGPFMMPTVTSLTYRVQGPDGAYLPEGTVWMDGRKVYAMTGTSVVVSSPGGLPTPPPQVATPVISPAGSTNLPVTVTIACSTTGAVVRYTLDGSVPTAASALYTGALQVASATVLRARGFTNGWTASAAASARFEVPPARDLLEVSRTVTAVTGGVARVQITGRDSYPDLQNAYAYEERLPVGITVSNITAEGVWNSTNRVVRWGPFTDTNSLASLGYTAYGVPGTYTVSGRWSVNGFGGDAPGTLAVPTPPGGDTPPTPPAQAAVPVLLPGSSTTLPVDVTITNATAGAEIRYTLDGSVPTAASALYGGAVHLASAATLRARAFKAGMTPSAAVQGLYEVPPTADGGTISLMRTVAANGSVLPQVTVTAAVTGSGALSYSVTETLATGLTPHDIGQGGVWSETNRTVKWGPFDDGQGRALTYSVSGASGGYALAGTGSANGRPVAVTGASSASVDLSTMQQVAAPTFSPGPETGRFPIDVTIACATAGAAVFYTTDGSAPDETSALYTGPVRLYSTARLRARAFKAWMLPSVTVSAYYSLERLAGTAVVKRTVSGSGTSSPVIWLDVTPTDDVLCYSVSETLPAGVTPQEVTEGGSWSAASRTLRWGPFTDKAVRRLTYCPAGPDGLHALTGSGSFNGHPVAATGDDQVRIENHLFARHRVDGNWSFAPVLTLGLTPLAGTHCHTVEEYLPTGVTPTNINHGGVWSAATRTIKWGPFTDDAARDFSFTLQGAHQRFETSGRISMDGVSRFVQRDLEVALGLPAPESLLAVAGNKTVYLDWAPCGYEAGFILRSWTQTGRADLVSVDIGANEAGFREVAGLLNGTNYFFALTAYDTNGVESAESATVSATPSAAAGVMGAVTFDRGYYGGTNETANVVLVDRDLNTNTGTVETVTVRVSSASEPAGILLVLRETAADSGRFEAAANDGKVLGFGFGASDPARPLLRVSEGDTLTVSYAEALPAGTRTATARFSEADGDSDGIPDRWERQYFGGYGVAGVGTDEDHDGMSDRDEWYGGYDPLDPQSVLALEAPEAAGDGTVLIRWCSVTGGRYILEKATGLSGEFYPLLENIRGMGPITTYTDVVAPGTEGVFYRVRLP